MDCSHSQDCGDVGFAGSDSADQDEVLCCFHVGRSCQCLDVGFWQRRFHPVDAVEIAMHREVRFLELIAHAANLATNKFGLDQPVALRGIESSGKLGNIAGFTRSLLQPSPWLLTVR